MNEKITYKDIERASERLKDHLYKTPLDQSMTLSSKDRNVFLKLECHQLGKSFKVRGAMNKLMQLSDEEKAKGVATISSGNHGVAVSYGARKLGISSVKVIVPETTPESKLEKIRFYGGQVVLLGQNYDEAHIKGLELIANEDMTYIDGGDDLDIYAGQGTVGMEIMQQNPDIDAIYVPIGGGALAVMTAMAAKSMNPSVKVYGLFSEACPAWRASIEDNHCHGTFPNDPSICEAMVGGLGALAFELRQWLDGYFEVKESMIKKALGHMVYQEKVVAEASGAVPVAALMQYRETLPGHNIALVISGGNVDTVLLKTCMEKVSL